MSEGIITDYPGAMRSHVIGAYYGRGERLPLFLMLEVMELMTGAADTIESLQERVAYIDYWAGLLDHIPEERFSASTIANALRNGRKTGDREWIIAPPSDDKLSDGWTWGPDHPSCDDMGQ